MGDSSKLWSERPIICNVDPKVMPHFSFHAKCNYCEEIISFTTELEREMRKHYNLKHRLYCNACKKSDFSTREELHTHLSAFHKDGICFNCHASFKLASALAMHVERPRNDCAVPHRALVNSLRYVYQLKVHEGHVTTDTNTFYSPISCCSNGENTVQKLGEFRKTLLLAHEKALTDIQQKTSCNDLRDPLLGDQGVNSQHKVGGFKVSKSENVTSPKPMGAVTDSQAGCHSTQVKRMVSENNISNRDAAAQLEMTTSLNFPKDQSQWTCSTCVDAKFTSLSKLLQHVEQKVRNSWWMSLHD